MDVFHHHFGERDPCVTNQLGAFSLSDKEEQICSPRGEAILNEYFVFVSIVILVGV